jgi:hypothetical protein
MTTFTRNELVLLSAALQIPVLELEIDLRFDLDLAESLRRLIDINFYSN